MTVTNSVNDGDALTWEEYDALPEETPGEYIDGQLVVSPQPSEFHQEISARLLLGLRAAVPATHRALAPWNWKPANDEFGPDVMVYALADRDGTKRFTGTPALCVEILSSNRRDDLVLKMRKYAQAGLPHYWIVDPRERTLTTYVLEDDTFRPTEVLHDTDPPKHLDLGVAHLRVDAATLFAD